MSENQLIEEFIRLYEDELHLLTEHYPNQLAYKIKLFKFDKQLENPDETQQVH